MKAPVFGKIKLQHPFIDSDCWKSLKVPRVDTDNLLYPDHTSALLLLK